MLLSKEFCTRTIILDYSKFRVFSFFLIHKKDFFGGHDEFMFPDLVRVNAKNQI